MARWSSGFLGLPTSPGPRPRAQCMVCWGASVVVSAVSACLCVLLVLVSMSAYSLQSESPLTSKTKFSGHRSKLQSIGLFSP